MATKKKAKPKPIEQYEHRDKQRANNPQVGLVTTKTDPDEGEYMEYQFDPHLDPSLHWTGKAERTSFEVPTVSLHVHERIDPKSILRQVKSQPNGQQAGLFEEDLRPLREAVDFYRHQDNWSNRFVAGDSLLIMNSLLQKEGMGGKVQMVYCDPPYGISYGSNFQPFINQSQVSDGKDTDLTAEPEMIKAFRDTWELGIHSYLSYMRDRLLLARDLLTDSGSIFVQIGDENVHRVSMVLDDIFGANNRVATISYVTTGSSPASTLSEVADYLLWYAKDRSLLCYHQLYESLDGSEIVDFLSSYAMVELADRTERKLTKEEQFDPQANLPKDARLFGRMPLTSQGVGNQERTAPYEWNGKIYECPPKSQWRISKEGLDNLADMGRLTSSGETGVLRWKRYEDEIPGRKIHNVWPEQTSASNKRYVVETATKAIQRCLLMATNPGDLVLDITCGSGTTAYVAEQWGRRWITCDTSRVALTLAKQRLMTAVFDYYKLANPKAGVGHDFEYSTVKTVSAKKLAEGTTTETILYDQPLKDTKKKRVTGPFTVEAVPAPYVQSLDSPADATGISDNSVTRSGETLRQTEWRDELLKTGIRAKGGQQIYFSNVEPIAGTRYLHAEAAILTETPPRSRGTLATESRRAVISFGPEYAPMEQRQVENAIQEAETLRPKPELIIFAAFQLDPEAAKDIAETDWPGVTLLQVQMNPDLLTSDLKKKQATSESFWLVGQPDVSLNQLDQGTDAGKWQVTVQGYDYFNTVTGELDFGDESNIAVWMLDTDYDGRSLYPSQIFFPMVDETDANSKDGWNRLAKALRSEVNLDLIDQYHGTQSIPFDPGKHQRIAIKIVDDRGIESLKVMPVDP